MALAFFKKAATVYTVFTTANYLSNEALHPKFKLDYGILNKYFPGPMKREVNDPFWGSRLNHLLVLPAFLTVTDLALIAAYPKIFRKAMKHNKVLSFKGNPYISLMHYFVFATSGIMAWVAFTAYAHPAMKTEDDSKKFIVDHVKPTVIGCFMQQHFPACASMMGAILPSWSFLAIPKASVAAALSFMAVKAGGFGSYGTKDLSPFEKKLNGIVEELKEE